MGLEDWEIGVSKNNNNCYVGIAASLLSSTAGLEETRAIQTDFPLFGSSEMSPASSTLPATKPIRKQQGIKGPQIP